jgi:hypothetical protein
MTIIRFVVDRTAICAPGFSGTLIIRVNRWWAFLLSVPSGLNPGLIYLGNFRELKESLNLEEVEDHFSGKLACLKRIEEAFQLVVFEEVYLRSLF